MKNTKVKKKHYIVRLLTFIYRNLREATRSGKDFNKYYAVYSTNQE